MYRHLLPHSGNNLRNGFRNGRLANKAGSNGLPLSSATEAGKVTNKTKTDICLEIFVDIVRISPSYFTVLIYRKLRIKVDPMLVFFKQYFICKLITIVNVMVQDLTVS